VAELSPRAQSVLDATDYPEDWATRIRVAAALRAAANQLSYSVELDLCTLPPVIDTWELIALADELDGGQPTREGD
jgi:hypothetical protein